MFKYIVVLALIAALATASDERNAEIKSLDSDVRADGFEYNVETSNGIRAVSSGDAIGNVHGEYEYTSPEGVHVRVEYVANENGYQPTSDLLPTPPPVPKAILRAIEYIRAHPPREDNYKN